MFVISRYQNTSTASTTTSEGGVSDWKWCGADIGHQLCSLIMYIFVVMTYLLYFMTRNQKETR